MYLMPKEIKVIDLFAGPGGLSEGFASHRAVRDTRRFNICMSVETDNHAHHTLELRAFFRQFRSVPDAYYEMAQSDLAWTMS